jgi:hypothetical protein
MRLSFYDEKSMEETVGSLRFGPLDDIMSQERLDSFGGQQGDDIEFMHR